MEAAANLTVFLAVTAYVVCVKGDRGVQEQVQGVNEENQWRRDKKWEPKMAAACFQLNYDDLQFG